MTVFATLTDIGNNKIAEFMGSDGRYFYLNLSMMQEEEIKKLEAQKHKKSAVKIEISLTK